MNISIFGLGYVGCVNAACLANEGHHIIGIDINEKKVDLIASGLPTVIEAGIEEPIKRSVANNRLKATMDFAAAVLETDISIICVGTPSSKNGHLNMEHVFAVTRQIGKSLNKKKTFHTISVRSTVMPGTQKKMISIIEEASGKKENVDFCVVLNPEFLREGDAVYDFYNPPFTLLGGDCEKGLNVLMEIYKNIPAPVEIIDAKAAEIFKMINNTFHALKVTFANEIGNICKILGLNSHEIMRLFCKDKKLNISAAYLKPGFAYGGSCLPKDLKALSTLAHDQYLELPLISKIAESNKMQKEKAFQLVQNTRKKKIGIWGISFKEGTDDLRESPIIDVIENLLGKGYQIKIFDEYVNLAALVGANKDYIFAKFPHIAQLFLSKFDDLLSFCEVLIINSSSTDLIEKIKTKPGIILIDLKYIDQLKDLPNYSGVCW